MGSLSNVNLSSLVTMVVLRADYFLLKTIELLYTKVYVFREAKNIDFGKVHTFFSYLIDFFLKIVFYSSVGYSFLSGIRLKAVIG